MSACPVIFGRDELDLIVAFAGCSLDEKPGTNWVAEAGGLPDYICRIARAVKKTGKTTSQAIAIAVSRVKKWATGAGVDADTQAKATAAVAEWEKLRAKSHARAAKMSAAATDILCLAHVDYDVSIVRTAFDRRTREARKSWRETNPAASYEDGPPYLSIKEQWTNYLIVSEDGYRSDGATLFKVPFTVDDKSEVTFGEAVEVKTEYVVVDAADMTGADLTDDALSALMATAPTLVDKLLTHRATSVGLPVLGSTALHRVLSSTDTG